MATKRRMKKNRTKRRGTRRGGMGRFHFGRKFASLIGKKYDSKTILAKKEIQEIFDAVDEQYENASLDEKFRFYNNNKDQKIINENRRIKNIGIINEFPSLTYEELKKSSTYKGISAEMMYKLYIYIQDKIPLMKESDTVMMHDFISELIKNVLPDRSSFNEGTGT